MEIDPDTFSLFIYLFILNHNARYINFLTSFLNVSCIGIKYIGYKYEFLKIESVHQKKYSENTFKL